MTCRRAGDRVHLPWSCRQYAGAVDAETGEPVPDEELPEGAVVADDTSQSASTTSDWTAQQDGDSASSADEQGPTYEELDDARRRYLQVERVGQIDQSTLIIASVNCPCCSDGKCWRQMR